MNHYFCTHCHNVVPEKDVIIDPYNEGLEFYGCPYCRHDNVLLKVLQENILEVPKFKFNIGTKLKLNEIGISHTAPEIRHLAIKNKYYIEDYTYSIKSKKWLATMRYVGDHISSSNYFLPLNILEEEYELCLK